MNHRKQNPGQSGERGFSLIATGICCVVLLGMAGLAVDLGRSFITKSEAQGYADAAAVAAALELDATAAGLTRAVNAVAASANRWHLGTQLFTGTLTDFSTSAAGPWETNPTNPAGYRFVRVRASANLPLYLLPVVTAQTNMVVSATAVGGQVARTGFREGLFPFSPYAHTATGPNYGLVPGEWYTLRYPASAKVTNVCDGDALPEIIALAEAGGGSERGFIEHTSADVIRASIEGDYQTVVRNIGDTVVMSGGAKSSQYSSLLNRIQQDTDTDSTSYSSYTGNGRRLVVSPINSGYPDYTLLAYGLFMLGRTSDYNAGGGQAWCAQYIGAGVQGSRYQGAGEAGAYLVRLVQ